MTPLDTCDAIERFLREKFGGVRLPAPDGGESAINFFQMSLPQPGAQILKPRPEDEEGNEMELDEGQFGDDIPIEEGGYTRAEARAIFPAVVIKPVKMSGGSEGEFWDMLTVVLTVGAFDDSSECVEGIKQVVNILERCRQLFEKNRVLENRFKVDLPITYELYDESVRPFFFGEMVTEWHMRLQTRETDLSAN
ncbi:MAG: hypothetical protein LBS35_00085 [Synergistaceae bacterium]|nr:hypothetical protein [Synergistaceae bacterium]